jgi:acyl-[acyl-carrier-protein]-phospholipid O-acyltransferase / long-chain-fatty-acid--[acyl-carrier-protein] ligase
MNLRASAMALSIFLIHLFGDMWSPEIVGHLADAWNKDVRKAVLLLPSVLFLGGAFWLVLALKKNRSRTSPEPKPPHAVSRWLLRTLLWALTHTFYRVRVSGVEEVPEKGGGLLVCNHLSLVDALLLAAATRRNIRFIMFKGIYDQPWIRPIAQLMQAIPISSELRPREMLQSLRSASEAIRAGELVCIFAEGQITRIGQLLPFRRGFERIMKDVDAPIIPVALDGVWGSIFSFEKGRFFWKVPRRLPFPVAVHFGAPLPHNATPLQVRDRVQELMAEAWNHRREQMKPLHHRLVRTARRHPWRQAMADAQGVSLRFLPALIGSVIFARRLRRVWGQERMIGLLLPPCVPAALINFAALLAGKVPVHLNYTVSDETLSSCIRQ